MLKKLKKRLNENDRIILINTLYSFFIKGGAMVVSLLTIPAYFRYFEDYKILGVWFTILSMITWIINFDLGIGNGLRNYLVKAIAEKNNEKIKSYISSAYISIALIVFFLSLVFSLIYKKILWFNVFGIGYETELNKIVLQKAILIVFIGVMIQFLLKLISSVLYAMQKSAMISFLGLISNISILIYISIFPTKDINTNLINMAYINTLAVNIPLLLTTIYLFKFSLRGLAPSLKFCKKEYIKDVLKLGGFFFFVQICYMLFINTSEFLISWSSGPEYVVEYQAYNRIFTMVGTVCNLALIPIWSAITKAISEKNIIWIEKTKKKLLYLSVLATGVQLMIIPFTKVLMKIWLDNRVQANYTYALVFAIFGSLMIWNASYSSIANGMGKPFIQAAVFSVAIIVKFIGVGIIKKYELSWIYIVIMTILGIFSYVILQNLYINIYIKRLKEDTKIYIEKERLNEN